MNITEEMDFKPKRKMTKEEALEQAAKEMFNVPFVDVETIEQEIEVYDKALDLYAAPLREEIERLTAYSEKLKEERDDYREKFNFEAEEIERLKAGQWVSVKERLPEVEGQYLTLRANGVRIIEHWYKKDSKFLWGDCYGVRFWMPLPPNPSATWQVG